jgi:hypothetical protein
MSSINLLSRRAILAGAASVPTLTLPVVAPAVPSPVPISARPALPMLDEGTVSDKKLRRLWSRYLKQVAEYQTACQKYDPARAAFDAELPPCPEDVMSGDHWRAHQWLWNKHGLEPLCDAWNAAHDAVGKTAKAIQRTKAESLFGVGVKLTALPIDYEEEDCKDALKSTRDDIDRLLGSDFAANVASALADTV